MRRFLFFIFLFCASLLGRIFSQNSIAASTNTYPLNTHPRLFFLPNEEAVLKAKLTSTPTLSKVHDIIVLECDKMLTLPVQARVLVGKRLLDVSREALRRICFLSYAYRMTGTISYADRAILEMKAMAAFSDWHPAHFLDVAEMTMGMAIGYDWLYNYMDANTRNTISAAIMAKGIETTTGVNAAQSWLTVDNNWNQVCNAGISAGVAAVYDTNPTYYQSLIDRAINSIKIPMDLYKNNGATPEGYGYWDYGTSFNVLFLDLLQRMWGTDSNLSAMPGFLSTGSYVTQLEGNATKLVSGGLTTTYTPQSFNFADAGTGTGVLIGLFGIAKFNSNPSLLYNELKKIDLLISNKNTGVNTNRLLPFALIWSMNHTLTNLAAPTTTTYVAQGSSALAVLRTGWGANDIYLGMKAGTPSSNHCHMDVGSFVMDAMDVRWAMDLGMSSYTPLETNGVDLWNMGQVSTRWDVFRLNNMAHNTLTINGNKQLVAGKSTIDNFINTTIKKSVDINLTPLYANDLSYCRRTGAIIQNRYVEIKDSIKTAAKALTVRWNLATQATPLKVSNKIIRLTQLGKNLYLIFEGTDNVVAKTWSATPKTTYEESNSDVFFSGFEYTLPSNTTQNITVKLVPEGDPLLNGLVLTAYGCLTNEDFETFTPGLPCKDFAYWKMSPATNISVKAVLGEIAVNPFKSGINTSNQVFKLTRQADSTGITTTNYGGTWRGAQAFGYDLRLKAGSVLEFKYYKVQKGAIGIRIYDGNGHTIIKNFTDVNEISPTYSTSQWRKAQFTISASDLTSFNATGLGYLLICPATNINYADQVGEVVMYVDDVTLSPLSIITDEIPINEAQMTAYYNPKDNQIYVKHLPQLCRNIVLYNVQGAKLQEINVINDEVVINVGKYSSSVFIVQAMGSDGKRISVKVICSK